MSEGLPKDKLALRLMSFAFAFAIDVGTTLAGGAGMGVEKKDQADGDYQGAEDQLDGQTAIHA
jgi:hypothetical protein